MHNTLPEKETKNNNRPKQSEIIISYHCRSIVRSKEKTPYKIAWFFARFILHAHDPRGARGGVSARGCEKSTMEKISSRSVTCRDNMYPAQAAIRPSQFSLPAAFERNTTPSLPLSAGCIFKTYHARDISRCRPLYSLSPNQAENHARTAYLRDTHLTNQ